MPADHERKVALSTIVHAACHFGGVVLGATLRANRQATIFGIVRDCHITPQLDLWREGPLPSFAAPNLFEYHLGVHHTF